MRFERDIVNDPTLIRVLGSFKEATGIPARLVTPDGLPALPVSDLESCALCKLIQSSDLGSSRCAASYREAGKQAMAIGDMYVFQCHAALVCWAAPLVVDGELVGSAVCGQMIMWEPDDGFLDEVVKRTADLCIDPSALARAVGQLERATTSRVQAAAELLFAVSSYIVESRHLALRQSNEIYRQQRLLGEAIHQRKLLERELARSSSGILSGPNPNAPHSLYCPVHEGELLRAVRSGRLSDAKSMLNDILADILLSAPNTNSSPGSGPNPALNPSSLAGSNGLDVVKARLLELAVFLARAAVEAGASSQRVLGLNYASIDAFSKANTIEDACFWILDVLNKFTDAIGCEQDSLSAVTREAISFMRRNVASRITVSDIASHLYLSPSHLSHVFKDETGVSLMDYMTAIRIEESKHLLTDAHLSITDVAMALGFNDSSYFSRCFKKQEGISPSEYRQRMITAGKS